MLYTEISVEIKGNQCLHPIKIQQLTTKIKGFTVWLIVADTMWPHKIQFLSALQVSRLFFLHGMLHYQCS